MIHQARNTVFHLNKQLENELVEAQVISNENLMFIELMDNAKNIRRLTTACTSEIPDYLKQGNCLKCSGISSSSCGLSLIDLQEYRLGSSSIFEASEEIESAICHGDDSLMVEFACFSDHTHLNLAWNELTGVVPTKLSDLKNLQKFIVFDNSLKNDICSMPRLQLLLGQNSISEEIPQVIGDCVRLLKLQLDGNYLIGGTPPEIGEIKNLQIVLNHSFNHLKDNLPHELGKLDNLVSLDVSNNLLFGTIPSEFKRLH